MVYAIYQILDILLTVLRWIILIHIVLSWLIAFNIINTYNDFVRNVDYALERITQPIYRPVRKIMPDLGALDLAPMVVLLGLYILHYIILPAIFKPLLV